MEQTFYKFGVEYLRWEDEKGNIWEAVKEQVEFLGKECFEMDPEEYYTGEALFQRSEMTIDTLPYKI